jgi:hypothetical protein
VPERCRQAAWRTVLTGGLAGLLTRVVSICQFPHNIAGPAEAAFGVFTGHATGAPASFASCCRCSWGNATGGTVLAALLNHRRWPAN